jgi:tetratricopeptide (TPR) repeat protein
MQYERGNKMRTDTLFRVKVSFIGILMLLFTLIFACSRGEQPQEKKAAVRATNPYSNESVFDEVQRKLKENPNDVDALFHLADLYERNAQYKEAIDAYTKVLKFKPEAGYIYFKMGTAYDRINQPAEAVKAFQSALKYMPSYAVAYNNMGVAYGKLNKPDEEITALNKAIKLRPKYASARYNLGITYMKIGNRKEALRQYEALKIFDEGAAEALMKEIGKTPSAQKK